jgi:osmotically-inducible protein OsmY
MEIYSMVKLTIPSVLVCSALALNACAPVVIAGAAGGAAGVASTDEGGLGQKWTDTQISAYIHDEWFRTDAQMFDKLYVTVFEGRVLIVGTVQKPEQRDTAIRLAWQAKGVRQVINEIRVEASGGISGYTRDTWIGTQFRTRLLTDKEVASRNYKYECNAGTIYLIGVARDQEELNHVLNHARNISYVRDVVSYVRLRSDTRPNEGNSTTIQNSPPTTVTNGNAYTPPQAPAQATQDFAPGYGSSTGPITSSELPPAQ